MKTDPFSQYIFWSYHSSADLPIDVVAEQVLLYGDLDDLFILAEEVPQEILENVSRKIAESGRWVKRRNFIDKILLDHDDKS